MFRLRERHQDVLRQKLFKLKQEQGVESEPLFPIIKEEPEEEEEEEEAATTYDIHTHKLKYYQGMKIVPHPMCLCIICIVTFLLQLFTL